MPRRPNQQLLHPRSRAAAVDVDRVASVAQAAEEIAGEISAALSDEEDMGRRRYQTVCSRRTHRDWTGRPIPASRAGVKPKLFARHRLERRLAVFHDGRRDALGFLCVQPFGE